MDPRLQTSSLDFARSNISNMLNQLRNEIQYAIGAGAFNASVAIKPEKRSQPQWGQLLTNLGAQLQSLTSPSLADTAVYNTIVNGGVPEGLEILFKNDVLVNEGAYYNLYNLLANFANTYGQMLQALVSQAQSMQYGKKYKRKVVPKKTNRK
jgi:hypothetical protein